MKQPRRKPTPPKPNARLEARAAAIAQPRPPTGPRRRTAPRRPSPQPHSHTMGSMPTHRLEVRPLPEAGDPRAHRLMREAAALGAPLTAARTAKVYLLEGELTDQQRDAIARALLVNPVT